MGDYTLKNIKEMDDAAVRFGLSPQMESRFAREALGTEQLGLSYQRLAPGARQPFSHRHTNDEELYVVLSGWGGCRSRASRWRSCRWMRCAWHPRRCAALPPAPTAWS